MPPLLFGGSTIMNDYRMSRATFLLGFGRKRPDDLPLIGRIVRERKGVYVVTINFAKSRRHYGDEIVHASSVKQVKAHMAILYPTLKFGRKK